MPTAPTIRGAEASPYTGYTFLDLIEHALNERGLTADATSVEFTQASTAQLAKVKRFIKDALAYLYSTRELWWPMREADIVAVAQTDGKFSRIDPPAGCGRIEAVTIDNQPLTALSLDEYVANLRPASEGGETWIASDGNTPAFYRMFVAEGALASTTPAMALQILPAQSTVFTATVYYRANGQGLSGNTDVVLVPIAMQPLMVVYTNYRWRLDDGDVKGADYLWNHLQTRLEELSFLPPGTDVLPVIHSVLPSERATRR